MPGRPRPRRIEGLVARARSLNQHPALVDTARRVRERAIGDEQFIDRLATARERPSDLAMRELAAVRSGAPGLLGEVGLTALGAWQRLSESQGRGRGDLDVAVLFTDLAGFSAWALEAGDDRALALLRGVSQAIEPALESRGGEIVKRLGDGLMGVFWEPAGAIEAALEAGERLASVEADSYHPQLRTGVHVGRPRKLGGDYFGVDVNIAARLAEAAEPGEVLVSGRALADVADLPLTASPRAFSAKGAPADLAVFAVARATQPA
ncbi:MAG TPA: adenylate/guanylate cyclase domain-containing protein [Solirubrobacteraceae bacterium]|jgi:adenylate cyclase|nr:adenylate/guanylate cyclase domain-containing protein [Solirubrobacteraceae bacterium]